MSIYYAFEFDKATREKLAQRQVILKQNSESGDWSDKESFHITLLYVGKDVTNRRQYMDALDQFKKQFAPKPFEIKAQNFNFFDNGNSEGTIAWIGVRDSLPMYEIKKNLETTLEKMAAEVQSSTHKGYTPHITMGYNVITKDTLDIKFEDDTPIKIASVCLWDSFKANDTYITNKIYEVFF